MQFKKGLINHPKVQGLIKEHRQEMFQNSPHESVHALNTGDFAQKNTLFWTLWEGEELLGCAAVRLIQLNHFELKSMRVVAKYRNKGLASSLITHIISHLEGKGAESISLETGTAEYFKPAIFLYKKFGFIECEPFGNYQPDPHSYFFSRSIS